MSGRRIRLGLRLSLLGALMTLVIGLATAAPAGAATSLKITGSDAYIKNECTWTVTSASFNNGTVRGRLATKSTYSSLAGYRELAHVTAECFLYTTGQNGGLVAQVSTEADGRAANTASTVTVPLDRGYQICLSASYVRKNGISGGIDFCTQP